MEAYLDNSATTCCSEGAAAMVMKVMREDFGNPSSMHTKGVEAEHYIREAKDFFAKNLKVDEKEIMDAVISGKLHGIRSCARE